MAVPARFRPDHRRQVETGASVGPVQERKAFATMVAAAAKRAGGAYVLRM